MPPHERIILIYIMLTFFGSWREPVCSAGTSSAHSHSPPRICRVFVPLNSYFLFILKWNPANKKARTQETWAVRDTGRNVTCTACAAASTTGFSKCLTSLLAPQTPWQECKCRCSTAAPAANCKLHYDRFSVSSDCDHHLPRHGASGCNSVIYLWIGRIPNVGFVLGWSCGCTS